MHDHAYSAYNYTSCLYVTAGYDTCLKPNIILEPGMHTYAVCTVPRSEHPKQHQHNRVQMFLYPPGGQCVVFQSETNDVWHHHNEHVHFRRKDEMVEMFIVDVNIQEHHNLSVVCRARRTDGRLIEGCSSEDSTSIATIYVVEADSESECNNQYTYQYCTANYF